MAHPLPVVYVDTEEERDAMISDFQSRKAKAIKEVLLWSASAAALFAAQIGWGMTARLFMTWAVGEAVLILVTAFCVVRLADAKSQTRWWGLIALLPAYNSQLMLTATGFAFLLLAAMPTPPVIPIVKLRSESRAW